MNKPKRQLKLLKPTMIRVLDQSSLAEVAGGLSYNGPISTGIGPSRFGDR